MGKTLLVYDMNLREMENYEKIYKDIGKGWEKKSILFEFLFHKEARVKSDKQNVNV